MRRAWGITVLVCYLVVPALLVAWYAGGVGESGGPYSCAASSCPPPHPFSVGSAVAGGLVTFGIVAIVAVLRRPAPGSD